MTETKLKCPRCEYAWTTKSEMILVTCPSCGKKVQRKQLKK